MIITLDYLPLNAVLFGDTMTVFKSQTLQQSKNLAPEDEIVEVRVLSGVPRLQDLSKPGEVLIYKKMSRFPQQVELTFDALLSLRRYRPEEISEEQVNMYPYHRQTIGDVAEYVIGECDGDFSVYADKIGTFNEEQVSIANNFDWDKCDPIDLQKRDGEFRLRNGRHRSIIIATKVLQGTMEFQPVSAFYSVYESASVRYIHRVLEGCNYSSDRALFQYLMRSIIQEKYTTLYIEIPESEFPLFESFLSQPFPEKIAHMDDITKVVEAIGRLYGQIIQKYFNELPNSLRECISPITIVSHYEDWHNRQEMFSLEINNYQDDTHAKMISTGLI